MELEVVDPEVMSEAERRIEAAGLGEAYRAICQITAEVKRDIWGPRIARVRASFAAAEERERLRDAR